MSRRRLSIVLSAVAAATAALAVSLVMPSASAAVVPVAAAAATSSAGTDTQAPSAPVLSYTFDGTRITLTWTASTDNVGVTGYEVYQSYTDIPAPVVLDAATLSYAFTVANPQEIHEYWVFAKDAAGNRSVSSNRVSIGTYRACPPPQAGCVTGPPVTTAPPADTTPPSTPTLSYTLVGNTLTLNWTPSTDNVGVDHYVISEFYIDVLGGVSVPGTVTTYTKTLPNPDERRTYSVLAVDAAGNASASSNTIIIGTIQPCTPGLPCPSASNRTLPPPTTAAAPTCAVTWAPTQWRTGFLVNVTLTNRAATALNGWTLTWTFPGNQRVTGFWNSRVTQTGAAVTASNATWNGSVKAGASVSFGLRGTYSGTNARPAGISLNGAPCVVS